MVLGFRAGNFSVYVYDERGGQHHLPHAHIKQGGRRVGSVFLITMEIYDCREGVSGPLLEEIRQKQMELLQLWAELNGDD